MFPALTLAAACFANMLLFEASLRKHSACRHYATEGQAGGLDGPSDCLLMRHAVATRLSWGTALTSAVTLQLQTLHIKKH